MRWGSLVVVAIALACNAASPVTEQPPPPPDQDAGAPLASMMLSTDSSVTLVIGEAAILSFFIPSLPSNAHVDLEGLPLGVSADDASFVRLTTGRFSITLHADPNAPQSIVNILIRATAPGFIDAQSAVRLAVTSKDGSLDPSFGAGGMLDFALPKETTAPGPIARASSTSSQMILALTSGSPSVVATRWNVDGTIDNTFGTNGVVRHDFDPGCDEVTVMAVADDGRIAISADTKSGCGTQGASPEGILFFGPDGTFVSAVKTTNIFPLMWTGASLLTASDNRLDSFTSDGVDTMTATTNDFEPYEMVTCDDGSVIATEPNETRRFVPNGDGSYTVDSSYAAIGGGFAIVRDANDSVVIGDSALRRLDASGALDKTFGLNGAATLAGPLAALVRTPSGNGFIAVQNTFAKIFGSTITLTRYDENGMIVATFGVFGDSQTIFAQNALAAMSAAFDAAGRLWVVAADANGLPTTTLLRYRIAP